MSPVLLIQGAIELLLSVLTGLFIFIISFKIFSLLTRDIDEIKELKKNNIAVAILTAVFILGIMLLVKSAIEPSLDTLKSVLNHDKIKFTIILIAILRIIFIYTVSALLSFLVLWFSIRFFMILTKNIDEMKLIKNNNVSVALLIAALILSVTIVLNHPIKTILNSLMASQQQLDWGIQDYFFNTNTFFQGLMELIIAIWGGIFISFLSFKALNTLTKEMDEIEELKKDNLAVAILASSFIIGIMILIKATTIPANEALGLVISSDPVFLDVAIVVLKLFAFFVITSIIAFTLIWLIIQIFMLLTTKIDEIAEIKNNNIAIAIILGVLIISSALLLEHGLTVFLQGLIKFPEVGTGLINIPLK